MSRDPTERSPHLKKILLSPQFSHRHRKHSAAISKLPDEKASALARSNIQILKRPPLRNNRREIQFFLAPPQQCK